jgi:hypothetical protein
VAVGRLWSRKVSASGAATGVEPAAGAVQDCTRLMAVGTHSRLSEGRLQEFFLSRGWGLLIDAPCTAHFTMTHPTLSGFTVQDGNQLWENPFVM